MNTQTWKERKRRRPRAEVKGGLQAGLSSWLPLFPLGHTTLLDSCRCVPEATNCPQVLGAQLQGNTGFSFSEPFVVSDAGDKPSYYTGVCVCARVREGRMGGPEGADDE